MKIALVSHSLLASGILSAAEMIGGETEDVAAFGLMPEDDGEILTKNLVAWLDEDSQDTEVLVLSDLYFGSPFNAMAGLSQTREIYHVTGMNLTMVIEAIALKDEGMSVREVAKQIISLAHDGIVDVNEVLANI